MVLLQQASRLLLDVNDRFSTPPLYKKITSSAKRVVLSHILKPTRRRKFLNSAATAVAQECCKAEEVTPTADTHVPTSVTSMSPPTSAAQSYLGYQRNLESKYTIGKQIGSGGYGTVKIVVQRETGVEFACKSVKKYLSGDVPDAKKLAHLQAVQNEIDVLTKLKGSLNVVKLEEVFEDDTHVHIVMQLCKGGELHHRVGTRHYTERTVAAFMRAVMRTLAVCHAHHILHRDIKPGNFMLLDDSEDSPLIAIDFGLAAEYNPEQLPRDDLGLEGTPWFMAPEVLSYNITPAADTWSAGVMGYQLLTGRMPFNDKRSPFSPSLSAIWRSILHDPLDFTKPYWADISDEAKDFVKRLLERDPTKRMTAKEALDHPWLQSKSGKAARSKPLGRSVVQRIQRFAQGSLFKQSVLQNMAQQLLEMNATKRPKGFTSDDRDPSVGTMLNRLNAKGEGISAEQLQESLKTQGAKMSSTDFDRLVSMVDLDDDGHVERSTLAASLIDWKQVQMTRHDSWLHIAHQAFDDIDRNGDGVITRAEIEEHMREHLAPAQMESAIRGAFKEAGTDDPSTGDGIDFTSFLRIFRTRSVDSLDMYDDRGSRSSASTHSLLSSFHTDSSQRSALDQSHRVGSYVKAIQADEVISPGPTEHPAPPVKRAVFNFDMPVKAPPPPTPAMVFRFDDFSKVKQSVAEKQKEQERVLVGAGVDGGHGAGRDGSGSGGRARPRGANVCSRALYTRPGFQEKRMHGSNLYKNAAMLRPVQE